jgi:hypothetical protein
MGSYLFSAVFIVTCTISTIEAVFLLFEQSVKPVIRPLIILIVLDLIIVLASGVVGYYNSGGIINDGINEKVRAIGLLLLAPCSLALFLSVPTNERVRSASIVLTLVTCAPVAIAFFIVMDLVVRNPYYGIIESRIGLLAPYWFIGMPIIGLCYLGSAAYAKNG